MPHNAYKEAAAKGTLIAVVDDGQVLAYALYSLPRQSVKLVHLCVSKNARGRGLARRLITAISERHGDRTAITLKCRSDYAENNMWPHLGFKRQGEVTGRSRQRKPLTAWRLDHGHPDLFSTAESLGPLRVMIDLNVFADIESRYYREESVESAALAGDLLVDQIELTISSELHREIQRLPDGLEKENQLHATSKYPTVRSSSRVLERTAEWFTEVAARAGGFDLAVSAGDISDVRHLSEAYLAGITVVATRDQKFIDWATSIADVTGVRVMRPSDVIVYIDELARAQEYQPAQIQDTQYTITRVRAGSEAEIISFLGTERGETKSHFLTQIRRLIAQGPRWDFRILRDPRGEPIALIVTGVDKNQLVIPILRVQAHRLAETVTRQLLFGLRKQTRAAGRSIMRITDPALSDPMTRAIKEEGFVRHEDSWIGFSIQACAPAETVDSLVAQATAMVSLRLPSLRPGLSAPIAAELERTLWPAKIIDSDLPTFLVPIRPSWSTDLFGIPPSMMNRPNNLGISREHVYYRSPRPHVEKAPGRLLWYASGSASRYGVTAVIACSRLEEVAIAKPAVLYERFRHLGVWKREQVDAAARDGMALAMRFADTEIFPSPVSLRRLKHLSQEYRQPLALQSPQKITAELFDAIYWEGHPPE